MHPDLVRCTRALGFTYFSFAFLSLASTSTLSSSLTPPKLPQREERSHFLHTYPTPSLNVIFMENNNLAPHCESAVAKLVDALVRWVTVWGNVVTRYWRKGRKMAGKSLKLCGKERSNCGHFLLFVAG
jgi:hypothetical protein